MDASIFAALLPADDLVRIQCVRFDRTSLVVDLVTSQPFAPCPRCGQNSSKVQGRYHRLIRDQPCLGHPLILSLMARKFACQSLDCPQSVFCERVPGLTEKYARTTGEMSLSQRAIGLALGGEAGARLAVKLALSASPDTILRRIKSASQECRPRPRYVGIDDWALRKGQVYGTILIDLERGTVIDLLPGRDGEELKNWLSANPQVEVITRDRWPAYIEAATLAAPQAKQVADRFHLLCNVREAIEKVLSRHGDEIRIASAAVNREEFSQDSAREAPVTSEEPTLEPRTEKDARREDKRRLREDHFKEVKELTARGEPCRKIARLLGVDVKSVRRYRRLDRCPNWNPGRLPPTRLDPYAPLIREWIGAGNRKSIDLFKLLKDKGFAGSYDATRRYLNRIIGSTGRPGPRPAGAQHRNAVRSRQPAPSPRKLSFRIMNPKPKGRSAKILERIRTQNPKLAAALCLAEELLDMFRQKGSMTLAGWKSKVDDLGSADLKNLAASLIHDSKAVEAAISTTWSNGPVEGQVNRLKTIKRQMYGRAGMKLLKARVLNK